MRRSTIAIGLALGAVAVALVGAGNASATVLCKVGKLPCPAPERYPAATEIKAELEGNTPWLMKAGFAEIECEESTITAKTNNEGKAGETVAAEVLAEAFGKCAAGQAVVVKKKGTIDVEWSKGTEGKVTLRENNEIEVSEGAIACSYKQTAVGKFFTLLGSAIAPQLTASEANTALVRSAGGILCVNPAPVIAEYKVTKPIPLLVEKE